MTDEILLARIIDAMKNFVELIIEWFEVRKKITDKPDNFNGCNITQREVGDIPLSMEEYVQGIEGMDLYRARRKQSQEKSTDDEYTNYRRMGAR